MEFKPKCDFPPGVTSIERYNALEFGYGDLNTRIRDELYQRYALPLIVDGQEVFVNFYEMALEALDPQPGDVIADLCCGSGIFTRMVAEACPDATVYGIDLSEESIENAREIAIRAGITNIRFDQGDVRNLDRIFHDGAVNKLSINYGLYLLHDADKAIEEMQRILAPGGSGEALTRGVGNLSRQWEETHEITAELKFAPQDSPYWNFDAMEAPERIGRKLLVVPFEPFDKLADPETHTIHRVLAMDEEAWPLYFQTLYNNVMTAILAQGGKPAVGYDVRSLVRKRVMPLFFKEANAAKGTYFRDTAEDGLVKFTKPN